MGPMINLLTALAAIATFAPCVAGTPVVHKRDDASGYIGTTTSYPGPGGAIGGDWLSCQIIPQDIASQAKSLYVLYAQTCCVYRTWDCQGDSQCANDGQGAVALTGTLLGQAYGARCSPSSNGGNFNY